MKVKKMKTFKLIAELESPTNPASKMAKLLLLRKNREPKHLSDFPKIRNLIFTPGFIT